MQPWSRFFCSSLVGQVQIYLVLTLIQWGSLCWDQQADVGHKDVSRGRSIFSQIRDSLIIERSSLEAFKARLDVALGSLGCWLATLHIAGGWNWMSIVVLSNPGHSMVL